VNAGGAISSGGVILSSSGGFKFPDGSVQTTRAIGDGHSLDAADGEPANALYVDATGQVGIGTTSPETVLSVSGAISGFGIVPIGTILPWHKSLPGVSALPDGWVECNGQVLAASDSPLNGQIIPDLNYSARFLRGATDSGTFQDDAMQEHTHLDSGHQHSTYLANNGWPDGAGDRAADYYWMESWRGAGVWKGTNTSYAALQGASSYGGNTARVDSETRPLNMSVVWIMRVK